MLPRMHAEEKLTHIMVSQIGNGLMDKNDAGRVLRDLKQAAEYKSIKKKLTSAQQAYYLKSMGIQMEVQHVRKSGESRS